jgi:hypothetical protein
MAGIDILSPGEPGWGRHYEDARIESGVRQKTVRQHHWQFDGRYRRRFLGSITSVSASATIAAESSRLLLSLGTEEVGWLADDAFRGFHYGFGQRWVCVD